MARLAGRRSGPDGQTPRDRRLTFSRHTQTVREAIARMILLDPQRVTIAHGRWYDRYGARELRRAFGWNCTTQSSTTTWSSPNIRDLGTWRAPKPKVMHRSHQ